ncbi:MAG: tRNA preQ1(34) S-adenosylmethionine ribosyltransferase-isomerase QueA [Patescibacteria group bacterium]
MRVDLFDYPLPPEAIAQRPLEPRDASRLLCLDRRTGSLTHHVFRDLPLLLRPGDLLVANDSRVIPARLIGRRAGKGGGRVEVLLLRPVGDGRWEVLVRPGRRALPGAGIVFGEGELEAEILARTDFGGRVAAFRHKEDWQALLHRLGRAPLPPYIREPLADPERYQTVYARDEGSVAAPTAGLHFTPGLLRAVEEAGIGLAYLTLHVGLGTFRPVAADEVESHAMHAEFFTIPEATAAAVARTRENGGRIVAVGTTCVRALEAASEGGLPRAGSAWTEIFIYPGYRFRAVDALVTNFHLPRSTLLMLVAAFAGRERILAAYREALACGYRFFSFGDAMLIL